VLPRQRIIQQDYCVTSGSMAGVAPLATQFVDPPGAQLYHSPQSVFCNRAQQHYVHCKPHWSNGHTCCRAVGHTKAIACRGTPCTAPLSMCQHLAAAHIAQYFVLTNVTTTDSFPISVLASIQSIQLLCLDCTTSCQASELLL